MDKFYDMNEQWIEKKNDWKAKYSNLKNKKQNENRVSIKMISKNFFTDYSSRSSVS